MGEKVSVELEVVVGRVENAGVSGEEEKRRGTDKKDNGTGVQAMKDTHKRSIIKAVGYKTGSIAVLAIVSYIFTGDWSKMTLITGVYTLIAIVGYYVWERIWSYIRWGRKQ